MIVAALATPSVGAAGERSRTPVAHRRAPARAAAPRAAPIHHRRQAVDDTPTRALGAHSPATAHAAPTPPTVNSP
jgi:hypothetical protein